MHEFPEARRKGAQSTRTVSFECANCFIEFDRLHAHVDSQNKYRCYRCFSFLDGPTSFQPFISKKQCNSAVCGRRAVIVLHAPHICGVARHCLELLALLREIGYSTTVIFVAGGGQWADRFAELSDGLVVLRSPVEGIPREYRDRLWRGVSFISCHYDPAISWGLRNVPAELPMYAHFHTAPEFGFFTLQTFADALVRCRKVFFPCKATQRSYDVMFTGDPEQVADKVMILPNVAPSTLHVVIPPFRGRSINRKRPRVAVVSRLDPDKFCLSLFLDTISLLLASGVQPAVRVAGGGEIGQVVAEETKRRGLSEVVSLLGFVENIESVYEWADIVFLPSRTESMPFAVLEAIAAGRTVVAPKLGSLSDHSMAHNRVLTFEAGDAPAAARLLMRATSIMTQQRASDTASFGHERWRESIVEAYDLVQPRALEA